MEKNSNNIINQKATYWIACQKEGLSSIQQIEFDIWLKENPLHLITFNKVKKTHDLFKSLSKEVSSKLSEDANKGAKRTKIIEKTKPLAFAAMFLLAISAGIFTINDYKNPSFSHVYITKNEKIDKIKLPDDSIIELDAKTNINIEFYKSKRLVNLVEGTVMFSIAKDKSRPFIIKSENTYIEVVGTKFEVSKKDKSTIINVEEGIVKTYHLNQYDKKKNIVLLTKKDTITYSKFGEMQNYKKIDINKIASWRSDFINLNKVTLKEAINKFSKYTDVYFFFSSKEVENYTVTGKFSYDQIDIFLKNISKIYPIKIVKNDKFIQISKKN